MPLMLNRAKAAPPAGAKAASWYSIRSLKDAAGADVAEVLIYDEIGFWGVTAGQFVRDLQQVIAPEILLRINSPGGDVFDGLAIFNALKAHPAKVTVQVDALAASIASVIALAGDAVKAHSNAFMMIHNPWSIVMGDAAEMRQMADILDKVTATLADVYAGRTKAAADQVKAWMDAETWFTAEEAKAAGLIDEVIAPAAAEQARAAAAFNLAAFQHAPRALMEAAPVGDPAEIKGPSASVLRLRLDLKHKRPAAA